MSGAAFCFLHIPAGSKRLSRGCPCPLGGSFGSCIQGSQQDLHSRLLCCGLLQGRLDGCGQANSQVVPITTSQARHVQIAPRTLRSLSLQRAGYLLPKMVRSCQEVPESWDRRNQRGGTAYIAAFPCFRGLCACKTGRVADLFLVVQPYLNNGVCMRIPGFL